MKQQGFIHKFLKGGAWALLIRILTVISNLALSMLIARMLAPDEVGSYFLLVSIISVVAVFSLLGLNIAVVRMIANSNALKEQGANFSVIQKTQILSLVASLSIALALYFLGSTILSIFEITDSVFIDYKILISIWIVLWSLENLNSDIFRGFKQFHLAALFKRVAPNIVILALSVYYFLYNIPIDLETYLIIVVIGWFSSLLLSSILLYKYFINTENNNHVSFTYLLSVSTPLWFTSWITLALHQIDLWVLAVFQPPEIVALYGAASRLTVFLVIPLLVMQSVVPPLIAESHALQEKEELSIGLQAASAMSFIPGILFCLVYFFAGKIVLVMVFGDYYGEAVTVLKILSVGMVFRLISGGSQSLLNMTGHEKTSMLISLFTGLFMVLGCLTVGERYGMVGIAIVAATSVSMHSMLNLIYGRLKVGIWVIPWLRMKQIKRFVYKK